MPDVHTSLTSIADDATYDVVVIGSGGAGLSAALCAAIDGARVLVVERTAHLGGTTALSAGTTWVPCTERGLQVQPDDTLARASLFLDLSVGDRAPRALREAFLANGPAAVAKLEHHSDVQYQVRPLHPDYLSELEGSALRGRAIEPRPLDGRLLGKALSLIRPPIPEFTVLGGMMVDRDDIFHLLRLTQSWASFSHALRIIARHAMDRLFWPRGTRLVMGNALIGRLLLSLLKRGVHIVTDTELQSLVQQGQHIRGVVLRQTRHGQTVQRMVQAQGGVVLASGGFNRHPQRRDALLPGAHPDWCPGAPGHTGQALDLALQAGATLGEGGLSHAFWAPVSVRRRADGSMAAFPHFVMDRGKPGMLTVNQAGRRYVNESTSYHLFGIEMQKQAHAPSVPSWLICDAAALRRYGLGMVRPGGKGLAPFLADGYLIQATTVQDLARQLAVDASVLQATLSDFNRMADTGVDAQFHRGTTDYQRANGDATWPGPNPCLGALREAPFYAIRLYPGDIGAATGLRTDCHARVLDAQGAALPGLYACGNEMHSIMGGVYPAPGITIGPGLVFGYLAAQHALARAREAS